VTMLNRPCVIILEALTISRLNYFRQPEVNTR